jgi:hypothetical protein
MRRLLLLPALAALVAATGCGLVDNGPKTTQTRSLDPFTRIDDDGSVDVRVHVTDGPQRVQVSAGRKVLEDVKTEVDDGTLNVSFDHHGWDGGSVDVEAWVPRLDGVHADGSGDIIADGIAGAAFEASADGSGDLRLSGTTGRLTIHTDGSGDAHADALKAREAKAKVGGSGDLAVNATDALDVTVDGSGDVRYHGDPALTQHMGGSGDIHSAD